MPRHLAAVAVVLAVLSTPLAVSAAELGEPEWVPKDTTIGEMAQALERVARDAMTRIPYFESPDLLQAVHAVLIGARQIAQHEELASMPAEGHEIRFGISELTFHMENLGRRQGDERYGQEELEPDDGRREKAAWYIRRQARDILRPFVDAAVLTIEPVALLSTSQARTRGLMVTTQGIDALEVVGEDGGKCKRTDGGSFRCPAPHPRAALTSLAVQAWTLRATQKAWFTSPTRTLDLALFVLPQRIGHYEIEFDVESQAARPQLRSERLSVWSSSNTSSWRVRERCVDASPRHRIDKASLKIASQWGDTGKFIGFSKISDGRICVEMAARGKGVFAGRGRYNVVLEFYEIPPEAKAEPVRVAGDVGLGETLSHSYPSGTAGIVYRIEFPDGSFYEGSGPTAQPRFSVEMLGDRVVIRGADAPRF